MLFVASRLPGFVHLRSDIPRPDDVSLQEIIDQHVFAEDLRTEHMRECTSIMMDVNQERTALEKVKDKTRDLGREGQTSFMDSV